MHLIDADALPHSWQPDCNGSRWFVSGDDIEHAPTVCCARCRKYPECAVPHALTEYWNQGWSSLMHEVACRHFKDRRRS